MEFRSKQLKLDWKTIFVKKQKIDVIGFRVF